MRRALILVLLVALATPVVAGAQDCWCVRRFAHDFTVYPAARQSYDATARVQGMSDFRRRTIKRKIYDWARDGMVDQSWCKSHPRLCKMLTACMVSASGTLAASLATGVSERNAAVSASIACATAAVGAGA